MTHAQSISVLEPYGFNGLWELKHICTINLCYLDSNGYVHIADVDNPEHNSIRFLIGALIKNPMTSKKKHHGVLMATDGDTWYDCYTASYSLVRTLGLTPYMTTNDAPSKNYFQFMDALLQTLDPDNDPGVEHGIYVMDKRHSEVADLNKHAGHRIKEAIRSIWAQYNA